MQERNRALRMGSGGEYRALVVGKDFEPRGQVARMIGAGLEFWCDAEIGAEEATAEFGDEFFARPLCPVFVIAAEIAVEPMRRRRPVGQFMAEDGGVRFRVPERRERRHLDVIARRRIERPVAAFANDGAGVGKESVGVGYARDGISRGRQGGVKAFRQTVDLRDVEDGIGLQERDFPVRFFARSIDFGFRETAREYDHAAGFAFSHGAPEFQVG